MENLVHGSAADPTCHRPVQDETGHNRLTQEKGSQEPAFNMSRIIGSSPKSIIGHSRVAEIFRYHRLFNVLAPA
jgi:hypothetical protein